MGRNGVRVRVVLEVRRSGNSGVGVGKSRVGLRVSGLVGRSWVMAGWE